MLLVDSLASARSPLPRHLSGQRAFVSCLSHRKSSTLSPNSFSFLTHKLGSWIPESALLWLGSVPMSPFLQTMLPSMRGLKPVTTTPYRVSSVCDNQSGGSAISTQLFAQFLAIRKPALERKSGVLRRSERLQRAAEGFSSL